MTQNIGVGNIDYSQGGYAGYSLLLPLSLSLSPSLKLPTWPCVLDLVRGYRFKKHSLCAQPTKIRYALVDYLDDIPPFRPVLGSC